MSTSFTRRRFTAMLGGLSIAGIVPARAFAAATATPGTPEPVPTPVCADLQPTPQDMLGPYFMDGSPETDTIRTDDMPGTRLDLAGYVYAVGCAPVAGAKVDVWQADANGEYDNAGYTLRGHVLTGPDGSWRMATILPGRYEPRPLHIHAQVTADGYATLTTQLYFVDPGFPDEQLNPGQEPLITETGDGLDGAFTFVLTPA